MSCGGHGQKSLILKVLGCNVTYRLLKQHIAYLWKLDWASDIVELEDGYYLSQFWSTNHYNRVLTGGPWVILVTI